MTTTILIIVLVVIVLIIAFWLVGTYNKLVDLRNRVAEAFATMDVYLKQRWDLVPNLVETVKGSAEFEKGTLEQVTEMRSRGYDSMSEDEKLSANATLNGIMPKLLAVGENYPDLKTTASFQDLNNKLQQLEADIANSRKFYNAIVREYNNKIQMFPSSIVAGIFHFQDKNMFEVAAGEREAVKVEF